MGKRFYSAIEKFKAVEQDLRRATNGFRKTMETIDKAMAARRSEEEMALLRSAPIRSPACGRMLRRSCIACIQKWAAGRNDSRFNLGASASWWVTRMRSADH